MMVAFIDSQIFGSNRLQNVFHYYLLHSKYNIHQNMFDLSHEKPEHHMQHVRRVIGSFPYADPSSDDGDELQGRHPLSLDSSALDYLPLIVVFSIFFVVWIAFEFIHRALSDDEDISSISTGSVSTKSTDSDDGLTWTESVSADESLRFEDTQNKSKETAAN